MDDMRRILTYGTIAAAIAIAALLYLNHRASLQSVPSVRAPAQVIPQYIPPRAWLTTISSVIHQSGEWDGSVHAHPNDEIWEFSSPPATWQQEMGTGGKCLLRGGNVIDGYATLAN
jgi:hypothetical protein